MKYNNEIIDLLLLGQNERAIGAWNRTLKTVIKQSCTKWSYKQFNALYGTMDFILNSDIFVKNVVNKRLFLTKAYEWTASENARKQAELHIETFYKILYHLIFFNKCLIKFRPHWQGYKINIVAPQNYYVLDGEIVPLGAEMDVSNTLYFGEELFDIAQLALPIVPISIAKKHNDTLWFNNNIYLNGFIHTSISNELIANEPDDKKAETLNKATSKLVDQVSMLSETNGVLDTPEGITIEHKDAVNTSVGPSYNDYITRKEREIENIILARSTQESDTAYASEKIRYMSTLDIQFADVKTLEHIANSVISRLNWMAQSGGEAVEFKVKVAADEDELNTIQILNGAKALGLIDTIGNGIMIDSDDFKELTGIPILNKGVLKLQASGGTDNAGGGELGAGDLGSISNVAATALNGAQIASLLSILEQVSAGLLPKATATTVISASFPMIDAATIQSMVAPIEYKPQLINS